MSTVHINRGSGPGPVRTIGPVRADRAGGDPAGQAGRGPMRVLRRLRTAWAGRRTVLFCDRCATVQVCDTACRVAAARDRAIGLRDGLGGPR